MKKLSLILYTRRGCCLCEGLEERLKNIPFKQLRVSVDLLILDIDGEDITELDKTRYDLKVPVLVAFLKDQNRFIELPRVSPRLKGYEFFQWLQKSLDRVFDSQ